MIGGAHEHPFAAQTDHCRSRGHRGRARGWRGRALAERYGLIPPDHGGIYGPGETLTYASQRLLTGIVRARVLTERDLEDAVPTARRR